MHACAIAELGLIADRDMTVATVASARNAVVRIALLLVLGLVELR